MRKRRIGAAKIKRVAGSMTAGMKTHAPSVSFAKTYAMMAKTMERTWMFDPFRTVSRLRFLTILTMLLTMLVKQIKQERPKKTNPTVDILAPSQNFPSCRHPGLPSLPSSRTSLFAVIPDSIRDPGLFLSQCFSWFPAFAGMTGKAKPGFRFQVSRKIKTQEQTETIVIAPTTQPEFRNCFHSIGISDRCQSIRLTKKNDEKIRIADRSETLLPGT